MQSAQQWREHNAQQPVMQWAYAHGMATTTLNSPRQENRRRQLRALIDEVGDAAELARLSGTPRSHISAILAVPPRRGIGDALADKWETQFDKPPGWFDLPTPFDENASNLSETAQTLAQRLSQAQQMIPPQRIHWGDLMDEAGLPEEFFLDAIDDAMAPLLPAGKTGWFSRKLPGAPGKHALLVDKNGAFYIRMIQERRADQWRAVALNDAFAPLDFKEDGLRVVAVMCGLRWE